MTKHTIDRLGHQGDGLAEGPIYVPRTLPGEDVTGVIEGDVLQDVRIIASSPHRVAPPCPHFAKCGGCQLQHASDDFLADWKQEVVRTALAAHGLEAPFLPIAVSPARSRRRATLAARRTKKGATVGFHGKASDTIVEIPACELLHPDLLGAIPAAEAMARVGASRKNNLSIAITVTRNGLDLAVNKGKPPDGQMRLDLARLAQEHYLARLTWNGEAIATRLPPEQTFDGITVIPPPGAFLQATAEGETALRGDVADIVSQAGRIVDLFAGCGTFALPLARKASVHAVESAPEMLAALDQAWRHAKGLKSVTSQTRDLFRRPLSVKELGTYDAAVIDPPRAGAAAQMEALGHSGVPVIAHVSCNPVTFARDARTLVRHGYRVTRVRVVDQFRWSPHVELVSEFRRDRT